MGVNEYHDVETYTWVIWRGVGMSFGMWVLVGLVVVIALAAASIAQTNAKRASLAAALKTIDGFSATQQVIGTDGMNGLAIDERRRTLCLLRAGARKPMQSLSLDSERFEAVTQVVGYRDVLSCELYEDGASVTKTSRTSQAAGAAVGGLLLGGVGMLIGGLSGSSNTRQKVSTIVLRLVVNDTAHPLHEVHFLGGAGDVQFAKAGAVYKGASENARRWYALVQVLIERANREDAASVPIEKPGVHASVADELGKLNDLRAAGVITDEEFAAQKAKLLR